MRLRLGLIFCAFGWHSWYMYCCRSKTAAANTKRECALCGVTQVRISDDDLKWTYWE